MEKTERLHAVLALQLEWIRTADSKVTALFAVNTAMLGVIAGLAATQKEWQISQAIFVALTSLPLLLSIVSLVCVLFPRLDGPRGSNIFFGGIASQDKEQFVDSVRTKGDGDLERDYAYQIHRNAEIASEKYKFIKYGFILTFASLPFFLAAIFDLYGA